MKVEEGFVVVPLEGRGMGCLATRCPFGDIDISLFVFLFVCVYLCACIFFVNSVISILQRGVAWAVLPPGLFLEIAIPYYAALCRDI